jgi:two-component system sensor histidine kinase YesM
MKGSTRTLRQALSRFLVVSLLVTFLFTTIVLYVMAVSQSWRSTREYAQNQLDLLALNGEQEVERVEQVSLGLAYNSTIQKVFLSPSVLRETNDRNVIAWVLSDYRNISDPGNIILFDTNGRVLTSSEGYREEANLFDRGYFKDIASSFGEPVWIPAHEDADDYRAGNRKVISLAQKVRRLDLERNTETGVLLGYILINVETGVFRDMLKKANWTKNGSVSILMPGNAVISSLGEETMKGIVVYSDFDRPEGWRLEGSVPVSQILFQPHLILPGLLVEVLLVILFVILSEKTGMKLAQPLQDLDHRMVLQDLSRQRSGTEVKKSGVAEIDSIQENYDRMIDRLLALTEQVTENQLREKEMQVATVQAELKSLQHQINPHFLYNTLDSINWMADAHGDEDIVEMVEKLADFLRFGVHAKGFVTLRQELKNVDNYIYIQNIRLGDRFRYTCKVVAEALDCQVLPLLIQPLVENSLVHGEAAHIDVIISIDDGRVRIAVRDDGSGISPERMKEVEKQEGVGLSNVAKRVRLAYGERGSFSLVSEPGVRTEAIITFPVQP